METMSVLYAMHCFVNYPRMCNISHNLNRTDNIFTSIYCFNIPTCRAHEGG